MTSPADDGADDPRSIPRDQISGRGGGGAYPPQQHCNGATVADYAAAKQIPVEFLHTLKVTDIYLQGVTAIRMPYFDREGHETAVRFRKALSKAAGTDERFAWRKGSKTSLYGLWRMKQVDYVIVCEGESDCHTLWFHDIPALGLPGASNWNEQRDLGYLDGIEKVYVRSRTGRYFRMLRDVPPSLHAI
jgi:hypothetical protein